MVNGEEATCRDRIRWAATHETARKDEPCDSAMVLVTMQCPQACGQCTQMANAQAWCDTDPVSAPVEEREEHELHFLQRFALREDSQATLRTGHRPHVAATAAAGLATLALVVSAFARAVGRRRQARSVATSPRARRGEEVGLPLILAEEGSE